jgi:hypothetical protein
MSTMSCKTKKKGKKIPIPMKKMKISLVTTNVRIC